jgi:hypothetical protein
MTLTHDGAGVRQTQNDQTASARERHREGDGQTATGVQSDNLTLRAFDATGPACERRSDRQW